VEGKGRGVNESTTDRIAELEERVADLKARLPRHSIPPAMLIELDELEEALEQARAKAVQEDSQ
jgi:hypothetical protein